MWPHPFKRLLFPFDRNTKRAQAQVPARVFQFGVLNHLDRGDAGIAIETVRVGNQRPKLLGRRFKIEFPAVVKFTSRHKSSNGFELALPLGTSRQEQIGRHHNMIEFGSTKELSNMIQAFSVKNYRGLRDFTIEPLDRVNLITGSNNVGKTALLEALYLNLATGTALNSNLEQGKRPSSTWINLFRGFKDVPFNLDNVSKWGWLFPGKDLTKDIELISKDEFDIHHVVDMYWRSENKSEGAPIPPGISLDDLSLFMDVKFQNNRRNTFIWKVQKNGHQPPQSPLVFDSIPLRLLFNSSSRDPGEDTKWFSTLADVGRQDEVVNSLKVIEPRLKNLAISTSDGPAMIYCDIGIGRRIPMSQMGEGMTRLLSLVLEITNASGGVV